MVFDSRGDDVVADARHLLGEGDAFDGGVDRLGAAAGEDHFVRAGAEQTGDGAARRVDRLVRFSGEGVGGGGVAELLV